MAGVRRALRIEGDCNSPLRSEVAITLYAQNLKQTGQFVNIRTGNSRVLNVALNLDCLVH